MEYIVFKVLYLINSSVVSSGTKQKENACFVKGKQLRNFVHEKSSCAAYILRIPSKLGGPQNCFNKQKPYITHKIPPKF